jgi:dTMP kinase
MLARRIRAVGRHTSIWNFPDYSTPLGRQLRYYLAGKARHDLHAVHLLYAANKWEQAASIAREISLGRIVLMNRYTPSNLAYGVAHGLSLNWLESLEHSLPKPDLVLILDVPPRVSFERKSQLRDVHEANRSYLERVRRVYLQLAKRYRWRLIDGAKDPKAVNLEAWRHVSSAIEK